MSLEHFSISEKSEVQESKLLKSHLEGMDLSRIEGLSESEKVRIVGEHVYSEKLENAIGLKNAFIEVSDENSKTEFAALYER